MSFELSQLSALFTSIKQRALNDFTTFLRFQSISSEPSYREQVQACAKWLANYLKESGLDVEIWQTSGHPVVFASYLKAGPDQPTLLIYHHYDVQPVDPLDEWNSPPFEPTIKNGELFARGAQDNKGQCFYTIQAIKALLERDGTLPINIKLCIEGEEEVSSHGLSTLINEKKTQLQADSLAIVDVGLRAPSTPAVTLGVRGLITMDLEVKGSHTDLHSGSHGGIVYNPIHALVELLTKLRDPEGKIAIPGFYDTVDELDRKDREQFSFTFDEKNYVKEFGALPTGGERNKYSPWERAWIRPTIEINGITGGYSGSGFKTVIPSKASAKISCRLVPHQDPEKIGLLIERFLRQHTPQGIEMALRLHQGKGSAVRADLHSPIVQAFAQSYTAIFQSPCEFILEGGSIPVVTRLAQVSGAAVVLVGLGLTTDNIHAPNEHFSLDRFEKGFLLIAQTLERLKRTLK